MTAENKKAAEWIKLLQNSGYRQTEARNTIVEVILETNRALEPLEIFEIARKRQAGLGLVTVYRTLERLEALGLVQRVHQPGACNMYLQAPQGHQHLLICTSCGKAEFFNGDDLTPLMETVAARSGYQITEHWFQLFGCCADCQRK
ncbi:Fur family transcriptional regulator [Leptolinea tardivitalis]|uniref:Fur family transcriptional regulator n=1 Tax=Leptolinea tardivitalis TaxID=229920 RepID=UPI0007818C8D|nr:Fur family transcriptional regulator [Leptolinea tardivitalis]GAP22009.1 Fe2+/Zn2+ uptake regulation protein [Leptolinea tardivitalis]